MILKKENVSEDWKRCLLIPIIKQKGAMLESKNYRGINLKDLREKVIDKRPREIVGFNQMQFGFKPGSGTCDVVFVLRQTKEKNTERQKKIYHTLVNLETAYNTAIRELIDKWL